MALPLPLRNRLADLILDALHDPQARQALEVVVAVCVESGGVPPAQPIPNAFPADLFEHREGVWRLKGAWKAYEVEFAERAERARRMLRRCPFDPADPPLATALVSAALLFHAHLYFEVHKVLERQLEGVPLDPFGRALQRCMARIDALGDEAPTAFDWNDVPRFPVRVSDE